MIAIRAVIVWKIIFGIMFSLYIINHWPIISNIFEGKVEFRSGIFLAGIFIGFSILELYKSIRNGFLENSFKFISLLSILQIISIVIIFIPIYSVITYIFSIIFSLMVGQWQNQTFYDIFLQIMFIFPSLLIVTITSTLIHSRFLSRS